MVLRTADIIKAAGQYLANTYSRQPIAPLRGRGMFVWDSDGKKYADFTGGVAVCVLGHCHPDLSRAISDQARRLMHVSNLYYIQQQVELAELLSKIVPDSIRKFFFCNSGAEAIEGSFKLAVKYTKRKRIVAMQGSFHGRTAAAVGATWTPRYREPYSAIIPNVFTFVPYNDLEAARKAVDDDTVAVVVEPVQGEGGVNVPSDDYLKGLEEICEEKGALLICDEIQTGMGRTGRWFACQRWKVRPDIITIAKGLGGGFPIGCFGSSDEVMDSFSPGDHASTFGGNPLACAAGIATVKTMRRLDLPRRSDRIGGYFKERLMELKDRFQSVVDVRGLGLLLGMELDNDKKAENAVKMAAGMGFLINRTAGRVLRFTPPLIVEKKHIDGLIFALEKILDKVQP
ncbi:MAG: acetylornithine/succinylornithine family transaminase [Candidatus Hadarchaeales archaeon]